MADKRRILVFGAQGATGSEVVRQAVAAGHPVRASEYRFRKDADLPPGVERMEADVLSGDLRPLVRGVDAVISCLGVPNDPATLLNPPPLYVEGTTRIVEAMQAEGVRRIVVISAAFVAVTDRGPALFRTAVIPSLTRVLDQMRGMEAMLRVSGLDWTAVRPGWLMKAEASGDPYVGEEPFPPDVIRARTGDVAALLLDCAANDAWLRKAPFIARDEPGAMESNVRVALEMLS
ncbi:NAD(P)-dependent oxidoreductase [Rubellimicrobium sp. CFH 75288]|uniref:NAD(P)-dependent oxidoreductase n=1 Tax=Rubellimicrobium sp. CFH 75288 TaxID=2697034 RepID=UPI0014120BDF|nr:NAD(P)H-binding protein [Rubellimicrobium sp. CFH 75288]NAZ37468.1 NAD(P)H-binding protein [Rubellimicrobium sp. CFH 75288]